MKRNKLISKNEKTPLLENGTNYFRTKKNFWLRFQYCMYGLALLLLITVIVILLSRSINEESPENSIDSSPVGASSSSPIFLFTWPMEDKNISRVISNDEDLWITSKIAGKIALAHRDEFEKNSSKLDTDSPSYRHQKVFPTSNRSQRYSRMGYERDFATKFFLDNINLTHPVTICRNQSRGDNFNEAKQICSKTSGFRSFNGSCNNLLYPNTFGVAFNKFRRSLPPEYGDGLSSPRKSSSGKELPSARLISNQVHPTIAKDDPDFTVMLAVWGQFIDHDITATALSRGPNGSSIACCVPSPHPECFPVILEANDPYYKTFNITCMEFVRSAAAPDPCFGPREQMTQTSAFMDGSVIYGSDEEIANNLRTFKEGKLKMFVTKDNRTLLPMSSDPNDGCNRFEEMKKGRYCFMTGDTRANENLLLTSMHLIWARQHNAVAKELSELNPHWNDEKTFQETRKIIGAQMQHVTYNEFLPIIVGENIVKEAQLKPKKDGYYNGYRTDVNPTISNSFASSAFRFAHSLLPSLIKLSERNKLSSEYIKLHEILFDPFHLYNSEDLDRNIEGAFQISVQANDPYFSEQLKEHLFENVRRNGTGKTCGLDLVSLNIQRGRDHGLPGYVKWRKYCGFRPVTSFKDLKDILNNVSYKEIQKVYRNVNDIDLYTGALSEHHVEGSILGPTFNCLVTDQFVRLKRGDRFWYENATPEGFTKNQLREIRKTTLAKILCDNSDRVSSIPKHVMRNVRQTNKYIPCSQIKKTKLELWKEE